MRLTWRDGVATGLVAGAALLYLLWVGGVEPFGMGARGLGAVVLGLGLGASITAVVYGVGAGLLRAPKPYLAAASIAGLVALVAGVATLASASEAMLAVLVVATIVLWAKATMRHMTLHGAPR